MNALRTLKLSTVAVAALAFSAGSQTALAQTTAVTATAVVQNTVTLNTAQNLHFGTVAVVPGAASPADDVVVAITTAGTVSVTPAGGGAGSVVDNALATNGLVEVTNFADGATINVDIISITNPTDGTSTLTFVNTLFRSAWNGGTPTSRTGGTPWTETLDAAFGGGTNTLALGASLTAAGAVTYGDGTYTGGFSVDFSY